MCPALLKGVHCGSGPLCIYAHSEGELRRTDAQVAPQGVESSQRQGLEVMHCHYAIPFPCHFIDHPDGGTVEQKMKAKLREIKLLEINQRTQSWDSFDEGFPMDAFQRNDSDSTYVGQASDTQQDEMLDDTVGMLLTVRNTFLHISPVQDIRCGSQSLSPGPRHRKKPTTPDHLFNAWTKHELRSQGKPGSPNVAKFDVPCFEDALFLGA